MRNFCKIDMGGGWLYSEFEVALWCHIPISGLKVNLLSHEEFLQKLIGVGGRGEMVGFGVALWCHIPNFRCDFSKFSSQREVKTPSPGSLRTVH